MLRQHVRGELGERPQELKHKPTLGIGIVQGLGDGVKLHPVLLEGLYGPEKDLGVARPAVKGMDPETPPLDIQDSCF